MTAFLSLEAQDDAEALDQRRLGSGLTGDDFEPYNDLRDERDAYFGATVGLGLAASTALVSGLLLYAFDDPDLP